MRISPRKLHLIPNGISLDYPADRAAARSTLGFPPESFVIGFVGRLVPQKNPQRLVETFARVSTQKPHTYLAIIGDGPLRAEIESECARLDLNARVRFFTDAHARDLMPGFDAPALHQRL